MAQSDWTQSPITYWVAGFKLFQPGSKSKTNSGRLSSCTNIFVPDDPGPANGSTNNVHCVSPHCVYFFHDQGKYQFDDKTVVRAAGSISI